MLVVGGLNWLLVGIFEWDLVAEIFGEEFGLTNAASRVVYILVGLTAIYWLARVPAYFSSRHRERHGGGPHTTAAAR